MSGNNRNHEDEEEKGVGYYLKQCGWFALGTAVVAGTALCAVTKVVSEIGFKEVGVEGGSMAARYQSANAKRGNNIEEGSLFSNLQRLGTKGPSDNLQTGVVIGSAAAVAALMLKKSGYHLTG